MTVRVLLDEHVGRVFERLLRERGHEVEQAKDRFGEGTGDAELPAWCAENEVVLPTNNAKDFEPLHGEYHHAGVVATDDVLGGEPRLEGRRVGVLQIADAVVVGGHDPEYVADQFGVSLAEVHRALAYYYEHPEEMADLRDAHEDLEAELAERSAAAGTGAE